MNALRVIKAELKKAVTVRTWWVLLIILFGYILFMAGLMAGVFGTADSHPLPGSNVPKLPQGTLPPLIYSLASSFGYVFPVLFGALTTTSEFRHKTLTPTFLTTPNRGIVLLAKYISGVLIGALFGVASLFASVGIGASILALTGHETGLDQATTWTLFARIVLVMAIWSAIGVGLGVMVPNQVAVIVIVLAFTQFLEPILRIAAGIWDWSAQVGKFLPGAASDAVVGSSFFSLMGEQGFKSATLDWWSGGLVLIAYALVAGLIGWFTSWRNDVA